MSQVFHSSLELFHADQLQVMRLQEATTYHCLDYLEDEPTTPTAVDSWCRQKMVEWCFRLADSIDLQRESVCVAMSYLDRFLSSKSPRAHAAKQNRETFQLAVMACFHTAIKLTESRLLRIELLSGLSNGRHQPADILQMEMDILHALQWRLNGPTALSFVEQFLAALSPKHPSIKANYHAILENVRYQIELSLTEFSMVTQKQNDIAIAALTNSIQRISSIRGSAEDRLGIMKSMGEIAQTDLTSQGLLQLARVMQSLQNDEAPIIQKRRVVSTSPHLHPNNPNRKSRDSSPKFVGRSCNERES